MTNYSRKSLEDIGIHSEDPRFKNFKNTKDFTNNFITKLNNGLLEISNWTEITNIITDIYNEVKLDNDGELPNYIPQLSNIDDSLFAVTFVSVDGQVFQLGNLDSKFCVQSCSKPITYGIILENYGEEIVHNFVGKEPSGRNFNELCLNEDNLPHNPLINSGAIMVTSLLEPDKNQAQRFDFSFSYWKKLVANNYLAFNNSIYLSEKDTADRNYCLGYMMQEKMAFQNGKDVKITNKIDRKWNIGDLQKNLELYFQFCSLDITILGAGLLAATLANGGIQPWTYEKIFKCSTIQHILSMMSTCGMYDFSGEWSYSIGIPAKSGVSGLIYTVIPGVGGLVTYSPKLDKIGNSYRGVNFFKLFSKKVNIHMYENHVNTEKVIIKHKEFNNKKILGFLLLEASYNQDLYTIREMIAKGCDINFQDYDNRTALHVAVSEQKLESIKLLLEFKASIELKDRWGKTPIDEATNDTRIINLLTNSDETF